MLMLARVVEYLRSNGTAFRLLSNPSPESLPEVSRPVVRGEGLFVQTRVLLIDGRQTLACVPRGEGINLLSLRASLGARSVEEVVAKPVGLPWPFEGATLAGIPPLGRLLGVPIFVDSSVAEASVIVFAAFGTSDFIEMTYEDFSRLEQPRILSFMGAGELPASALH